MSMNEREPEIQLPPERWEQMARNAYNAYGDITGHLNYQGLPMPEWEQLTEKIQAAWMNAVKQVALDFHIRNAD